MKRNADLKHRAHLALLLAIAVSLPLPLSGCAGKRKAMTAPPPPSAARGIRPVAERLVTRHASLTVRVVDVSSAAARVEGMVGQAEGLVTQSSRTDDTRVWFELRVPSARLEDLLDQLAGLGRASQRTVTARDVTEEAFDLDARLQNKKALRERLRGLVASTSTLQDVLLLEEQLARVQAEIDTLEGQVERLRSDVALSRVTLALERERQLGPLGHVLHGLWSGIRRLFVWR